MEKYLLIDTNIFVQCSLLEEEGDDFEVVKKLLKLMDESKLILLLPEVIELEFEKVLIQKSEKLRSKVGQYIKSVERDNDFDSRIKHDLMEKMDDLLKERVKYSERTGVMVRKIFGHKNTVHLAVESEMMVEAYKYFLSNEKPFRPVKGIVIQPDCLIIESAKNYFSSKDNYVLYFCSLNKRDFAENEKSDPLELAKSIKKKFVNITYYLNLGDLLKEKFQIKLSPEAVSKLSNENFQKEALTMSSYSSNITYSQPLTYRNLVSGTTEQGSIPLGFIPPDISNLDPDEYRVPFSTSSSTFDLSRSEDQVCTRCGKTYPPLLYRGVNGICDDCLLPPR